MSGERISLRTVDLDNCHREPIQTPGSVQPHGVLIALGLDGALSHVSRNASLFFPLLPPLGQRPNRAQLWSSVPLREAASGMLEDAAADGNVPPLAIEASVDGSPYDVVLHAHAGRVLLEFERRDPAAQELASFAVLAHRSMSRLKGRPDIDSILAEAVSTVRQLTGFDRVMAYRFHADDSGEIIAEARHDALEPYLGRRFPASDIPVQARRLYLANTLRLIADVNDEQVVIVAHDPAEAPLDLSHSILRSVSPIHLEYLKNINVAASMSVSIVVAGKLWGLIACHHRVPHRVPYAVRMACDVLAHVVAASVQILIEKSSATRRAAALDLRTKLLELGTQGEELPVGLGPSQAAVARVIPHDRMLFSHGNDLRHDGIPAEAANEMLRWLDPQPGDLIALHELGSMPEALRQQLLPLSGLLAMRHDRVNRGWLVLLRNEQTATVTWSGPPDKVTRIGAFGARLTPDGSLAEWRQDVRGTAAPWDDLDLQLAGQILDEIARTTASRAAEMELARTHLLAILGHDLRDPLQSISMAALMLERGRDPGVIAKHIAASTGRMGRLIAQVLDMSRLHGGLGLGLTFRQVDLPTLVRELLDESALAYPNAPMHAEMPDTLVAEVDRDRLTQVITNLLGNARQHGTLGETILLRLEEADDRAVLTIANLAPPITVAVVAGLFDPLKRGSLSNQRNPNGLGLGLYIANEAIRGHQGSISYRHDGTHVVFTVDMPLRQ